jgi:hypothetical protein
VCSELVVNNRVGSGACVRTPGEMIRSSDLMMRFSLLPLSHYYFHRIAASAPIAKQIIHPVCPMWVTVCVLCIEPDVFVFSDAATQQPLSDRAGNHSAGSEPR